MAGRCWSRAIFPIPTNPKRIIILHPIFICLIYMLPICRGSRYQPIPAMALNCASRRIDMGEGAKTRPEGKGGLRSRAWFDNPDNPDMTALYLERYRSEEHTSELHHKCATRMP